jgi:hypothetical protein
LYTTLSFGTIEYSTLRDSRPEIPSQACFFLPWKLLEDEYVKEGIRLQIKYNTLLEATKAFDATLLAVARLQADEELVDESFRLLVVALDDFIATVPAQFRDAARFGGA